MYLYHNTEGVHEPALVIERRISFMSRLPSPNDYTALKVSGLTPLPLLIIIRYHCHTCKMVDGVGVCTVCAKVCHKDHEISYAKYGSFFCDCGAKEDGSCQVRPNTSGHHGKRTTAVTLACKSVLIDRLIELIPSLPRAIRFTLVYRSHQLATC